MAEILVENRICSACGADVRKGALFCFSCGSSVAPEIPASEINASEITQPAIDESEAAEHKDRKFEIIKPENEEPERTAPLTEVFVDENLKRDGDEAENKTEVLPAAEVTEISDIPVKKTDIIEEAKLKSAASLRRKAKTVQKRKVEEIVWTGHDNAPNLWFILVAVVLTLLAFGIFWMAMQLK
jgi:hypothetical protein